MGTKSPCYSDARKCTASRSCGTNCGGGGCFAACNCRQSGNNCDFNGTNCSGDFPSNSSLIFFTINCLNIKPYHIKFDYRIDKGLIGISSNVTQYQQLNNNPSIYTMINGGIYYSTNINLDLPLYKQNVKEFTKTTSSMVTFATSYFINQGNSDFKKLNKIWKKRIGFNTNDYNFYVLDYYYDYYVSKNGYAYDCIRIISQKRFIWNLIYNLAKQYNISIDFEFYQTFYTAIFENLYGTTPITAQQLNIYFDKYHPEYMPLSYNSIIQKWVALCNLEEDVVNLIILKQASCVLTLEELENVDLIKLYTIFDYQTVKFRFLECLSANNSQKPK
jgi:hypothetical protein